MTGVGGEPRTQAEFIVDTRKKITSLERQLSRQGAIDLAQRVVAGYGISIDGVGSTGDPMVISLTTVAPPPLPDPVVSNGPATSGVSSTAGAWASLTGWDPVSLTPDLDLWVEVNYTAMVRSGTGYIGIGVAVSGAFTLAPPAMQDGSNVSAWGQSPFREGTVYGPVTGSKLLLLPAGVETVLTPQVIRNVAGSSQNANYPIMRVLPLRWA